ncbi:hypothetical protein CLV56_4066 [Mumia flava]|uniref:Sap-like sulfolipid-1-addressing protein n=1 Tax=Mumia flava TaxID=1348852 RepID=A0A0B2BQV6_9ACTN|nr:hypothetical protein [Mumia flava]PJJ48190.1 hypothetical protein CLV56_4066 [Mumia flava]
MLATLISLAGLGLVMSFSPTLYALEVTVLTRADHPVRLSHVIVAGVLTGAAGMVLLLQVFNPDAWAQLLSGRVQAVLLQRGFDIVVGSAFVLVGVRLIARRREPRPERSKPRGRILESARTLFAFTSLNTLASVGGAASTYVALRLIREADGDLLLHTVAFAVFFAAIIAPYVLLLWGADRLPSLRARSEPAAEWLRAQPWHRIGGIALIAVGGVLVGAALTDWYGAA